MFAWYYSVQNLIFLSSVWTHHYPLPTDSDDGGWRAERLSVELVTEADWLTRSRGFKCAEPSKYRPPPPPPSSLTVTCIGGWRAKRDWAWSKRLKMTGSLGHVTLHAHSPKICIFRMCRHLYRLYDMGVKLQVVWKQDTKKNTWLLWLGAKYPESRENCTIKIIIMCALHDIKEMVGLCTHRERTIFNSLLGRPKRKRAFGTVICVSGRCATGWIHAPCRGLSAIRHKSNTFSNKRKTILPL
jgi:hypothetical protein